MVRCVSKLLMYLLTVCKCFNALHIRESPTTFCLHILCASLSSHVGISTLAILCMCHCYDNNIACIGPDFGQIATFYDLQCFQIYDICFNYIFVRTYIHSYNVHEMDPFM